MDMCVSCWADQKPGAYKEHDAATHGYQVVEQHSVPIYVRDWGADEEMLLLEAAELYGLGSWAEIADHVGGYRTKDEVRDHYIDTYVDSTNFPLPERADPKDTRLLEEVTREEFQQYKKRRIEERKEAAKNAQPPAPKQKPTASVPSCHEVQGYMPGRLEFETEYANEAEEAVQHMQFEPGEVTNPRTGEMDPEMELKLTVMHIYNDRLTARATRKKIIFQHGLLEYRKNAALDKKRTKEEREVFSKAKPFARMTNQANFKTFCEGVELEHNLRAAITQLQDWRRMKIGDLKSGEKYELEKQQRAARPAPTGTFDRMAGIRPPKPMPPPETASTTVAMVAPGEIPERLKINFPIVSPDMKAKGPLTNGAANSAIVVTPKPPYNTPPLPGVNPMALSARDDEDIQLLSKEERELCSVLRIKPKPYLVIKEGLIREATKSGGGLRKKNFREICKVSDRLSF
jgi:transcriptional adapter 2-alpha